MNTANSTARGSWFQFCPHCGTQLVRESDQRHVGRPGCPSCGYRQYRNPTVGVAVVLIENDHLLIGQRRDGGWCIPCGHVEWDESVRDAACREFLEETGLEVELLDLVAVKSNFHNPNQQTVGIWFRGRRIGGKLCAGSDLTAVEFVALAELPALKFPTDNEVVSELRASQEQ